MSPAIADNWLCTLDIEKTLSPITFEAGQVRTNRAAVKNGLDGGVSNDSGGGAIVMLQQAAEPLRTSHVSLSRLRSAYREQ